MPWRAAGSIARGPHPTAARSAPATVGEGACNRVRCRLQPHAMVQPATLGHAMAPPGLAGRGLRAGGLCYYGGSLRLGLQPASATVAGPSYGCSACVMTARAAAMG
eukprot:scaffold1122_cov50-Phaeocystis_antarctica.AAC.4